jgi:hypothetical protein
VSVRGIVGHPCGKDHGPWYQRETSSVALVEYEALPAALPR